MHGAPAVRYPAARSVRAGRVFVLLCGVALAVNGWWWRQGAAPGPWWGTMGCMLFVALLGLAQWRAMRPGALRWDGQAWWWSNAVDAAGVEHPVTLAVRLDLGTGVLVQLSGLPAGSGWRYLERTAQAAQWNALRRALYSPATGHAATTPSLQP